MASDSATQAPDDTNVIKTTTYHQYGFSSCQNSLSRPQAIEVFLDSIYEKLLNEQQLDRRGINDKIGKLRAEILQENNKKSTYTANLLLYKQTKEEKEKEIDGLENEKANINQRGDTSTHLLPFAFGAFILLMLTLLLFTFYSSASYSVFYGINKYNSAFINPNVFGDALIKGWGAVLLVILFPAIFLCLGFLIHVSLESKKYARIIFLLVIALIADSLIGYKITYSLYLYAFDAGHTNRNWQVTDVFIDPNFYLVLVLGFFVYVIWGFLLNFILGHPLFKTESEIVMNINKKISEKRNIIQEQLEKILKTENEIEICNIMISEKESVIIDYQYGNIPMDISKPRGAVSEFMKGWQAYVINSCGEDEAVQLINEAIIIQKKWLTQKTEITIFKKNLKG